MKNTGCRQYPGSKEVTDAISHSVICGNDDESEKFDCSPLQKAGNE